MNISFEKSKEISHHMIPIYCNLTSINIVLVVMSIQAHCITFGKTAIIASCSCIIHRTNMTIQNTVVTITESFFRSNTFHIIYKFLGFSVAIG